MKVGDFVLPGWFNRELLIEFFDMWASYRRTAVDYYENPRTALNFKECKAGILLGGDAWVEGEYFHKSANIGWIRSGSDRIYHVCNAERI